MSWRSRGFESSQMSGTVMARRIDPRRRAHKLELPSDPLTRQAANVEHVI